MDKQQNELKKSYFRAREQAQEHAFATKYTHYEMGYLRKSMTYDEIIEKNFFLDTVDKAKVINKVLGTEYSVIHMKPIRNVDGESYLARIGLRTEIILNSDYQPSIENIDEYVLSNSRAHEDVILAYINTKNILENKKERYDNATPFIFGGSKIALVKIVGDNSGGTWKNANQYFFIDMEGNLNANGIDDRTLDKDYSSFIKRYHHMGYDDRFNDKLRNAYMNTITGGKYDINRVGWFNIGNNNLAPVRMRNDEGRFVNYLMDSKGNVSTEGVSLEYIFNNYGSGYDDYDTSTAYANSLLKKPMFSHAGFSQEKGIEGGMYGSTIADDIQYNMDFNGNMKKVY